MRGTTRRAVLRGTAAASVAGAFASLAGAAASSDADPAVRAAAIYLETMDRSFDAECAADAIYEQAAEHFPHIPAPIRVRYANPRGYYLMMEEDANPRQLELIAAYKAECDKICEPFGYFTVRGRADALLAETRALLQALRLAPATTIAGLLAKMRIAAMFGDFVGDAADPETTHVEPIMLASVLSDLERLAAASTSERT